MYQSVKLIKDEIDELFQERQQLEAQLHHARKMESLGTLTGGFAHDFNKILSVIVGNTELAIEELPLAHPVQESLTEIKSVSLRGSRHCSPADELQPGN